MEGRVRQENPEEWVSRRDVLSDLTACPASEQDNRALWRIEEPAFRGRDRTQTLGCCVVGDHHGEGPFITSFSRAQLGDDRLVAGVTGQVIAAEPFDRGNATRAQDRRDERDRVIARNRLTALVPDG